MEVTPREVRELAVVALPDRSFLTLSSSAGEGRLKAGEGLVREGFIARLMPPPSTP